MILQENRFFFKFHGTFSFFRKSHLKKIKHHSGSPTFETRKRPATQGNQFKQSMQNLMKLLLSKNPNYIRCIKPNETKAPNRFDTELIRHQEMF